MRHDALQKVPVVGHHDQRPPPGAQIVLQPEHHVVVQVVGRLVQDEHVTGPGQHRRQGHPAALPAGQLPHALVEPGHPQPVEDGPGLILRQGAVGVVQPQQHLLQHGALPLEHRILGQVLQTHAGIQPHRAPVGLLRPGQQAQQGGLSRAVDAHDAHFVPPLQIKGHPVQQDAVPVTLGQLFRRQQHTGPSLRQNLLPVYRNRRQKGSPLPLPLGKREKMWYPKALSLRKESL